MAEAGKTETSPSNEYDLLRRQVEVMAVRHHPHGTLWDHVLRGVMAIAHASQNDEILNVPARFSFDCTVRALPLYEKSTGDTYSGRRLLGAFRAYILAPGDEAWAEVGKAADEVNDKLLGYSPDVPYDHVRIQKAKGSRDDLAYVTASAFLEHAAYHPDWVAFHLEWASQYGGPVSASNHDAWMKARLLEHCSGIRPVPLEVPDPVTPKAKAPRTTARPAAPKKPKYMRL